MANGHFTPTQKRILEVLGDGMLHPAQQLLACIDELASDNSLWVQITALRKLLRPQGQDIICHRASGTLAETHYCVVRLLASPYRE